MPNFLVAGAAKCATSSLDRYLALHPDIYMAPRKEAHFFATPDFPEVFQGPGDDGMNRYTLHSRPEYESLFQGVTGQAAVGESSVFYLYYRGTAKRIAETLPDAKVILLLRNPTLRAYSAYMHLVRDGRETRSFEDGLMLETARKGRDFEPMWLYRELGLYADQVERFLRHLGRSRVKVLLFEEFTADPQAAMRDLFRFLHVSHQVEVDTSRRINESGLPKSRRLYDFVSQPRVVKEWVKPLIPAAVRERIGLKAKSLLLDHIAMAEQTRADLERYFEVDIRRLETLLGRDLSIWRRQAHSQGQISRSSRRASAAQTLTSAGGSQ